MKIMKFFNIPVLEEDEHIYSYFLRTGHANGLTFKNLYAMTNYRKNKAKPRLDDYETILGYTRMYEMYGFNENTELYESPVSLYIKGSIYNGIAPFTTQNKLRIITAKLNKYYYSDTLGLHSKNVSELHICPQCMEEDIKRKGFFYYHRAHQMPGVSVCYKHNCRLKKYNGQLGEELNYPIDLVDVEIIPEIYDQYEYAVFCNDILNDYHQPVDGFFQIQSSLRKIADETASGQLSKEKLDNINGLRLIILCFSLFQTKDNLFVKTFDTTRNDIFFDLLERFSEFMVKHDEYEWIKTYNDRLVRYEDARLVVIRDKKCNTQFIVRLVDFLSGDDCPHCNSFLSAEERHIKRFNSIMNINKQLIKLYIEPSDMNYDEYDTEQLGDYSIEEVSKKNNAYVATVKHIDCGTVFEREFTRLISSPWCPKCHKKDVIETAEDYENAVRNLVGDEYTIVGKYEEARKKITFRHNTCGKLISMRAYHFLDGQRCSYCKIQNSESQFMDIVQNVSCGRYLCIGSDHSNALIKDTTTGKVKTIPKKKVLQELYRFDNNSKILPLEKRNISYSVNRKQAQHDVLFSRFCNSFRDTDLIFADELSYFTEGLNNKTGNLLRALVKQQKIFKIAFKTYALTPVKVSNEEIIHIKYVDRNGEHIGYYKGVSFAYDVGLTSERPKQINMCSNIAKGDGYSKTECDLSLRITATPLMINNQNWAVVATLDFLRMAKKAGFDYHELKPLKDWLIDKEVKIEDFEDYYQYFASWVRPKVKILYEEN